MLPINQRSTPTGIGAKAKNNKVTDPFLYERLSTNANKQENAHSRRGGQKSIALLHKMQLDDVNERNCTFQPKLQS